MSLQTNITNALQRLSNYAKQTRIFVNGNAADLSALTTSSKSNLIGAINEVNAKTASAGAAIDDTTPRTSTVYSSSKTDSQIATARAALKNEILGGASAAYDTLLELQNIDISQDTSIASLLTADGNRLRFDAAQALDATQKAQGNTNLGSASLVQIGDPNYDFDAAVATALA